MGKKRTVVLLVISLGLATGAAWTANSWLEMRTNSETAGKDAAQPVVVATVNIPYGQKIERQHLSVVTMPKSSIPSMTFPDTEQVEGKIASQDILKGDIVRGERVVEHLEGSTLAAMIAKDKRAVTVRVNDVIGVAGFLLPGNHVDVVAAKSKNRGETETQIVLKRIRVLAVDQTAGNDQEGRPVVVRAVTLEVSAPEAETLVKATDEGHIQLALRNPLDLEPEPEPEPKEETVEKKPIPKIVQKPSPPTTAYVTVIRGIDSNTVRVKN